jgi:competence transcription factor ComK
MCEEISEENMIQCVPYKKWIDEYKLSISLRYFFQKQELLERTNPSTFLTLFNNAAANTFDQFG